MFYSWIYSKWYLSDFVNSKNNNNKKSTYQPKVSAELSYPLTVTS